MTSPAEMSPASSSNASVPVQLDNTLNDYTSSLRTPPPSPKPFTLKRIHPSPGETSCKRPRLATKHNKPLSPSERSHFGVLLDHSYTDILQDDQYFPEKVDKNVPLVIRLSRRPSSDASTSTRFITTNSSTPFMPTSCPSFQRDGSLSSTKNIVTPPTSPVEEAQKSIARNHSDAATFTGRVRSGSSRSAQWQNASDSEEEKIYIRIRIPRSMRAQLKRSRSDSSPMNVDSQGS